jgi:hypothetical protein
MKEAASRVWSLMLKMEAVCFSEISADFYRTVWHYIPEFFSHHCENLESKIYETSFAFGFHGKYIFTVSQTLSCSN